MRRTPLKRTRMKRTPVERDWSDARAKVDAEGACRVCGKRRRDGAKLEAAHVIGRHGDRNVQGETRLYVDPDHVVPLCSPFDNDCHGRYDRREIGIRDVLTDAEWAAACALIGEGRAERRTAGRS